MKLRIYIYIYIYIVSIFVATNCIIIIIIIKFKSLLLLSAHSQTTDYFREQQPIRVELQCSHVWYFYTLVLGRGRQTRCGQWECNQKESGRLKERTWLHTIDLNRIRISDTLQQITFLEILLYQCQRGLLLTFTGFNRINSCIF